MKYLTQFLVFLGILVSLVSLTSCNDMNRLHRPYIKDGETIYPPRLGYNLTLLPGFNKMQVLASVEGTRIQGTKVLYTNSKGEEISAFFPYVKGAPRDPNIPAGYFDQTAFVGKDLRSFIVENIEEGPYEFTAFNIDQEGNESIKSRATGIVYGSTYENALSPRPLSYMVYDGVNATLNFVRSNSLQRDSRVTYTKTDNTKVTEDLKEADTQVSLEDIDLSKGIIASTEYVPIAASETPILDIFGQPTGRTNRLERSTGRVLSPERNGNIELPLAYNIINSIAIQTDSFSWGGDAGSIFLYEVNYKLDGGASQAAALGSYNSTTGGGSQSIPASTKIIEVTVSDIYNNSFYKKFTRP